jgi:hypothetical protein
VAPLLLFYADSEDVPKVSAIWTGVRQEFGTPHEESRGRRVCDDSVSAAPGGCVTIRNLEGDGANLTSWRTTVLIAANTRQRSLKPVATNIHLNNPVT